MVTMSDNGLVLGRLRLLFEDANANVDGGIVSAFPLFLFSHVPRRQANPRG
uniref:Uncharacterized protein n=1 Tax=Rhizophora mucronata TaxID=61149 RepID=A0A2P2QGJ6_RHIMU